MHKQKMFCYFVETLKLKDMEITDEKIDKMLHALDDYARDIDIEYGLPCLGDLIKDMRIIVRESLNSDSN